jgi:hypothetical protein
MAHPGVRVPNSARRVGEGLDVRGDGGYVVAPPSRHGSARRYRWMDGRTEQLALRAHALPPMPAWLLELAASTESERHLSQPVMLPPDSAAAYAKTAVEREALDVAAAAHGERNDRLNRAAFNLGQLVGAQLLDELAVTEVLVAAALAAGPDERKIRATVRRGLRAGMRRPRQVQVGGPNRHKPMSVPEACSEAIDHEGETC